MSEESSEATLELLNDKYFNEFKKLDKIDEGSYGTVWKAEEISTKKLFAIKKIWLKDPSYLEHTLRDLNSISKLKSPFIVEYISAWRDVEFAYIQMELCMDNLDNVLKTKPEAFHRGNDNKLNLLEFYLSSQLFKEVTEGLNYLHTLSPRIMHRDLNPRNVLITDGINGRFIKLCDFGLAKDYEKSSNTRNVGTAKYIAWECRYSRHYNYQADIFSLAVIGLDIFGIEYKNSQENINCSELLKPYLGTNLEKGFEKLVETINFCVDKNTKYEDRYSCAELLVKIDEWNIDKDSAVKEYQSLNQLNNQFFIKYARANFGI